MSLGATIAVVLMVIVILAGLVYWLLVLTEGSYLGRRVLAFLYDRSASDYDEIKKFDQEDDARRIGEPLVAYLGEDPAAAVLDIATGTGRVPLLLLGNSSFRGRVIGMDISQKMLDQAWQKTRLWAERIELIWHDAGDFLPFPDGSLAAVSCLEALEFFAHPQQALKEMVRVLRPGGILLVTNRVGLDFFFFPGRALRRASLEGELKALGLEDIDCQRWQTYYDLVWARKPNLVEAASSLPTLLCPVCRDTPLQVDRSGYSCPSCGRSFTRHDGFTHLRE